MTPTDPSREPGPFRPSPPPVDLRRYRAWLFDLDGVLTRTADVHAATWKQVFDEFLDEESSRSGTVFAPFDLVGDYARYVDGELREDGVRNFLVARGIELPEGDRGDSTDARTVHGLGNRKNTRLLRALEIGGVPVYEGAIELVQALHDAEVPMAVVSSSENAKAALDAAGIADFFPTVIDGHAVKDGHLAGKPAPDSFLEAARVLGVEPETAVVVEDAPAGVEAGHAGRFGLVIGVDHHADPDRLRAHGADLVVADLAELLR